MGTTELVGAGFAAVVLIREGLLFHYGRQRRIAACSHHWNKPFWGMGTWNRNCLCCDHQQHSQDGENWK